MHLAALFLGASTGSRVGESLSRQATTPLKPGGGAISVLGLGDPRMMLNQTPPAWPTCILWLINARPFFASYSGYGITASTCQESEGSTHHGSLDRQDAAPLSSQGSSHVELPPFLPSGTAQGDVQLLNWLPDSGHQNSWFNSGYLCRGQLFGRPLCGSQLFGELLYFSWNGRDFQFWHLGTL